MKTVQINGQDIQVKAFTETTATETKEIRVLTFGDIDRLHDKPEGSASKRFFDNKDRFLEGEDFYRMSQKEFDELFGTPSNGTPRRGGNRSPRTLITESGYLMLVKVFSDDIAWNVQRELVKSYFRVKESLAPKNPMDLVLQQVNVYQAMATAMIEQQAKIKEIDTKLQLVANETSHQINDLRRGLVDIDAPLRTDLHDLIKEYTQLTGKDYREAWHFLYDNLNSRNKCNIQRRAENRTKRAGKEVKKLDIIEEMRLLPDAIRFMKTVVENLKLLAKQVRPQTSNQIEPF